MTNQDEFDTDVLVIGAGPMGATTALALATYGIRVTAISRANWVANSPRAHVTNMRAMEILRDLHLEEAVLERATPTDLMAETKFVTSLAGQEIARIRSFGTGEARLSDYAAASPCTIVDIPQSLLEPVLIDAAAHRGAHFEFNTLYVNSEQDQGGVTAQIEHRLSGTVREIRARYLIGADGARSRVATDAGLQISGESGRAGTVYAQFSGDLSRLMAHRPSVLTWVANGDAATGEIGLGLLRAVRPWDRWIAGWNFDVAEGDPDLSFETARDRVRAFVGDPDFEPEITGVSPWYVNEACAPVYSNRRILCGGDAMHRHPPSNGLGSNTSIQDAYNLAWKLAYVVKGIASPSLLDSYSAERAPVGEQIVRRANQSRREFADLKLLVTGEDQLAGLRAATPEGVVARRRLDGALAVKEYEWNALGVEMNQRYSSDAILTEDGSAEEHVGDDWDLDAFASMRPGAKVPHAWLVDERGRRISTLDLVGRGRFTLLTGLAGDEHWSAAVAEVAEPWLDVRVIGADDAQDLYSGWARISEIEESGALLVRPDGVIAWRAVTAPDDPNAVLHRALRDILNPHRRSKRSTEPPLSDFSLNDTDGKDTP